MIEPKKRGRPAKAPVVASVAPSVAPAGKLRVKRPDAIHDGHGGFLAVGAMFDPADAEAGAALVAKGLAE